jgi:hypothetical protein
VLSWRKYKNLMPTSSAWLNRCCDLLEARRETEQDLVLVALNRLTGTLADAWETSETSRGQTPQQQRLMHLGLEAQFRAIKESIPEHISSVSKSQSNQSLHLRPLVLLEHI